MARHQLLQLTGLQTALDAHSIGDTAIVYIAGAVFIEDLNIAFDIGIGNIGNVQRALVCLDLQLILVEGGLFREKATLLAVALP